MRSKLSSEPFSDAHKEFAIPLSSLGALTLPVHDPVLIMAIAMAAFLILPLITNKLRLPDIVGVLVAGMIVGPYGIGLLERDETIQLLGTVGLLYLVFLAGLEVDLGDLSRKRGRAITFGVLTFLVPQLAGTLGALIFFGFPISTSILLGSVFSSHSFLALLIAKRLGLTNREMTIAVIGGTVITDTLALFVLAVVAQSVQGEFGALFLTQMLIQTIVFSAVVVFGVPLLGRRFFRRFNDGGAQFVFMLTVLFTCGFVAHVVKLEPIIGAFLAGLAMNRLVPHHGTLANRAFFIGNTIFVPFFLLSVGMLIDLRMVVGDVRTIEMAIFMTLTVILCKGLAAWMTKKLFNYTRDDAIVAWGLSMPQAATTLAVVLVGHKLELFDDAILNATIVMVLITCLLGPMLVQFAGRRIASSDADEEEADFPSDQAFQRILIPLSNPQSSNDLLDFAAAMRRPLNDEPLLPVSVANHESDVARSERLLEASVLHLAGAETPVSPVIRVDPNPVNGILRAQSELRANSLIVGWKGPESSRQRHFHLNRGLIDELLVDTTCQMLVVRHNVPLSVVQKVVLVVPAFAHAEPGFNEIVADVKMLSKRIGASLQAYCLSSGAHMVERALKKVGPTVQYTMHSVSDDVVSAIADATDKQTLVVLVGAREGTLSWSGQWSREITTIAHAHADVAMAIAYPRIERSPITQRFNVAKSVKPSLLRSASIYLNQAAENVPELIRGGIPSQLQQSQQLLERLHKGLSALNAKVALVHGNAQGLVNPHLSIVVQRDSVEHGDFTFNVLLVLLNPIGWSAQKHLDNLAKIARVFSDPTRVEQLLHASDEAAARKALLMENTEVTAK